MMGIGYRFFTINTRDSEIGEERLNNFLCTVTVVSVRREFVADGGNSFWSVSVEYMESAKNDGEGKRKSVKSRVDYKKILSPDDFTLFAKLRDWRREIADKTGLPLYNIMNNEQLAGLAKRRPANRAELTAIDGIGEGRADKYGETVIAIVAEYNQGREVEQDEKSR